MARLHLAWVPDDDQTGRLTVAVEADGFAAEAARWVGQPNLEGFVASLSTFPILPDRPLFLSDDVAPRMAGREEDFAITIGPAGATGGLRIRVEISSDDWPGGGGMAGQKAILTLRTDYEVLRAFAAEMTALLAEGGDAALTGDAA